MKTSPEVVCTGPHYDLRVQFRTLSLRVWLSFSVGEVVMRITLSGTGVRNVEVSSANGDIGKDDQCGSRTLFFGPS